MKHTSLWDKLMFPFRMRQLQKQADQEYIESLERWLKFWRNESVKMHGLYIDLKNKENTK